MWRRKKVKLTWQMRMVVVVLGVCLIIIGLVFATYVNIVKIYWGDVELFSGVMGTIITMLGGAFVVKGVIRG